MNQKQRTYVVKELGVLKAKKQYDLLQEFEGKKPTLKEIVEDIRSGKIVVDDYNTRETDHNLYCLIPDDQKIKMIKMDLATISGRTFTTTKSHYIEAIKNGVEVLRDNISELENKNALFQFRLSVGVKCLEVNETPEYKARLKVLEEEHKKVERTIMLGDEKEVIEVLKQFEETIF